VIKYSTLEELDGVLAHFHLSDWYLGEL
jgi:hypothetical protein